MARVNLRCMLLYSILQLWPYYYGWLVRLFFVTALPIKRSKIVKFHFKRRGMGKARYGEKEIVR